MGRMHIDGFNLYKGVYMIYRSLLSATRGLHFYTILVSLLVGAAHAALQPTELPSAERAHIQPHLSKLQLELAKNRGKADTPSTGLPMQFHSAGHVLGFTPEGVLVAGRDHLLKVNFVGAAAVTPKAATDSVTEHSAAIRQGTAPLTEVHYRNLWRGIDLRYDAKDGIVRSTYTLAPGAKAADIRLAYNVKPELTKEGSLTLNFATGTLTESAPIAWQEIKGKHKPVQVAFHQYANGELGFILGSYDSTHPLTIDPTLVWNTFLGGTGSERGRGIATDASGNVYVIGESNITWGAPVQANSGGGDAFVARLDAVTGALTWNTFLGGANSDIGRSIATDAAGNVYVTGRSLAAWGAPVRAYSGNFDVFVARLNAANGVLTWSTFLGGGSGDDGFGIATDAGGNVYVTGLSNATWETPIRAFTVGGSNAFVARLNAATGVLTWNTFLGGGAGEVGQGIATDAAGNVYVTGSSTGAWGTPVLAFVGSGDAFVARLVATTGVLTWNTFLGGVGVDVGLGIATDAAGNLYVTGYSEAAWGTPVRAYSAGADAFVARLAATGALTWNTFLGAAGTDEGNGIATDTAGNVYVTGASNATWGTPVRAYTSGFDALVARLNAASGALAANTFLGAAGSDEGFAIATDSAGNAYATGFSSGTWGTPVRAHSGSDDAFVARLAASAAPPAPPTITNGPPPNGTVGVAYTFSYTSTGSPTFSVTAGALPPGLNISAAGVISGTPTTAGTFNGTVTASNGNAPDATQAFSITITAAAPPPLPGSLAPIPTLSEWAMIVLTLLVALLGISSRHYGTQNR